MNFRTFSLLLLGSCILPSCLSLDNPKNFTPNYLKEDSNLDKPGAAAARAAERVKRKKSGAFATDLDYALHGGKVFLFEMNPEYSESASGKSYEAKTAKVIFCEGTYYFVELDTKERGYIQETSMMQPVALMMDLPLTMDGSVWDEALPGSISIDLDDNMEPLFPSDSAEVIAPTPLQPAAVPAPTSQDIPDLPESTID